MINIVAFIDSKRNSVAYKKYENDEVEKAVKFYQSMLRKEEVSVISTRKTKEAEK